MVGLAIEFHEPPGIFGLEFVDGHAADGILRLIRSLVCGRFRAISYNFV